MKSAISVSLAVAFATSAVASLNPSCAPGGNFDLSPWELQLPIGSPGSPETITSGDLQGCGGYQNYSLFFTESGDGALVMKVPPISEGCVKTPNSKHCRTELREVDPSTGSHVSWSPGSGTNRLSATLEVPTPDDSYYGTVIGQIHIDDNTSTKPVCELYYNSSGAITLSVEQSQAGGDSNYYPITTLSPGSQFSYQLIYEDNTLSVSVNNGSAKTFATSQLDNPDSYFKAGNYNQGSDASDVHFFAISIQH